MSVERAEEQRLLARARRGDGDAFAALYRAHLGPIYRYIAHRVQDARLAEDLTGDVFMRALEALPSYEERGRPFLAWLYRIAHARVIDHYRQTGRRPQTPLADAPPLAAEDDLDQEMLRRGAAKALRAAIAALTEDQQQVIILRFIEGCSIERAAQIMGKQPNAIKALQFRALRTLAGRLARGGFDIESILAGLS